MRLSRRARQGKARAHTALGSGHQQARHASRAPRLAHKGVARAVHVAAAGVHRLRLLTEAKLAELDLRMGAELDLLAS